MRLALANQAHVSANTVVRFEYEKHEANASTVLVIKQALEAAGVLFTVDGGVVPPPGRARQMTAFSRLL